MSKLNGKVAIVTGAGKGIGAGIAVRLAAEGAAVAVNYAHDTTAADTVVDKIRKDSGTAIAVQADVAQPDDVANLFASTREAFGPVDILVNNAGVFRFGPLGSISVAEFHRHFDTNVLGALLTSQEFANQREADGGSIINITSVGVSFAQPNASLYTVSKTALVGVTRTLSVELAPRKIRVNAIAAGLADTEGVRATGLIGSDAGRALVAQIPLGRIGVPEDIGPAAAFLASEDARWITGDTLFVTGGQY
ncbi:glucose 1-dehydrogenase [Streptomyces caniscabiei]|uniref:SDR family NAD(P)-dependent oxidoreductase n=1 Tax=Streptomyces caniscabiei TaxID=2746961 RepID=UPI0029B0E8CE|nr:glucose 1-dehydrogenase [Streptomyces caniscabiei]MDX2604268.1 glucose 1-dehydrogenase [Streptomyces caniscabiei]MDX2735610.1 glucose 1-dehydrogenase [Streptomyces caniscabiei]MDX2781910.1 glucose 1-dehydrogenase [Streptomyces caniscabiei]